MMAPYLIVSDIHGNYEALEAVLEDARGRYDRILCLGDLVGYGADPNQVAEWAKSSVASVVRGNHDRACTGTDLLEYFNPAARASAFWTRGALTPDNWSYLEHLARGPLRVTLEDASGAASGAATGGFDLVHGSPRQLHSKPRHESFMSRRDVEHLRGSKKCLIQMSLSRTPQQMENSLVS